MGALVLPLQMGHLAMVMIMLMLVYGLVQVLFLKMGDIVRRLEQALILAFAQGPSYKVEVIV